MGGPIEIKMIIIIIIIIIIILRQKKGLFGGFNVLENVLKLAGK